MKIDFKSVKNYRQALRDVPEDNADMNSISLPSNS